MKLVFKDVGGQRTLLEAFQRPDRSVFLTFHHTPEYGAFSCELPVLERLFAIIKRATKEEL